MPNPPTRQIYLPNFKLNISVPAEYSDDQVTDAIQRNKAQIQQASPVFAQGQKYLQNGLGPDYAGNGLKTPALGITEQQVRAQGIGPAVQAAQDAAQYNSADQVALLRHYAAVRAINSANQHPNAAQIVAQAQPNLLPTDRLTAIGDRATRAMSDVVNTPLLNQVLDYGAPGASRQLEQMQGYGSGLARGVLGFSSPGSLGAMALLGPIVAEPMGAKMLLEAFGTRAVGGAYERAQAGDVGGALGELTAYGLPFALHLGSLAQEAKNAADYQAGARWMDANYGVDAEPPTSPLLPPGPDPNVYEAEFRPERPTAPLSTGLAAPLDRSVFLPPIASDLPADSFLEDPTGNMLSKTRGSAVPTSYGQGVINLQTDPGSAGSSSDSRGPGIDTPQGGMVPYRSAFPLPSDSVSLSPGVDLVASSPTVASPPDLPRVPLVITSGEARALSALLGEQHPFSTAMDQLFADGRTKAEVPVTLPQLTAFRNLAEQTTRLPDDEPGSYNRAVFLKRLSATSRNFSDATESALALPQTLEGTVALREPFNSASTIGSNTAVSPSNYNPTAQKRAHLDALRGQIDNRLVPMQMSSSTVAPDTTVGEPSRYTTLGIGNHSEDGTYGLGFIPSGGKRDNVAGDVNGYFTLAPRERTDDRQSDSFSMAPEDENENWTHFPEPRFEVNKTLAKGHLSDLWYHQYIRHVVKEEPLARVPLQSVLEGETLERARHCFNEFPQILHSPVVMCEKDLPDDVYGTILKDEFSPTKWQIAINGRIAHDPEDITFIIAEEAEHIAQQLRGMPFDNNPIYAKRTHEIEAKKVAFLITGRLDTRFKNIYIPKKPNW